MANTFGRQVGIDAFNPQAGTPNALPAVSYAGANGGGNEALATVSKTLADQVNALGDELAKSEGRKAGAIAGADPAFRPSDTPTLRGKAFDEEASKVYFSNLNAKFQSDAMDVFEANKADPAGFKNAYDRLVDGYRANHVFPEVAGYFNTAATTLNTSLRQKVVSNFDEDRKDQARAAYIANTATADTTKARLLAVDPSDPKVEAQITAIRNQQLQNVDNLVAGESLTAAQGAKQKRDILNKTATDMIAARGATLKSADEVSAYRAKVKADFAAGRIDGLQDWDSVDSGLATLAQSKATAARTALADLNRKIDDFVGRSGKGFAPPSAEWATLGEQARAIGPAGEAALNAASSKLRVRARIDALPLPEAESFVRDLEAQAKGGASARVAMSDAERDLAIRTVYGEAGGESETGQAGVAHVMKTRALGGGAALRDVITAPKQFSVWNAGDPAGDKARALSPDSAAYKAIGRLVDGVMAGTIADPTKGADHYYAPGGVTTEPAWAGGLARTNDVTIGNHRFVGGTGRGVDATTAAVLDDARTAVAAKRALVTTDPLLAAERTGLVPRIAPLDPASADLPAQVALRVSQADAVGAAYERAPQYLRPDEKAAVKAVLDKGGDDALRVLDGVVAGARGRAPAVLAEIGGDAPEMAHAANVTISTGDKGFARQVAEAIRTRAVPGAKVPTPSTDDVATAMRKELGTSLVGIDPAEAERTRAAATAWITAEYARRGVDPKAGDADIVREGLLRARGMTGAGSDRFGGVADYKPRGFWQDSAKVQVPADVRPDKFGTVLDSITDADLASLKNPPVTKDGRTLTADELRRTAPVFGPGGYRFGTIDGTTKVVSPVAAKDGGPFVLPWNDLAPALRSRVPGAFR